MRPFTIHIFDRYEGDTKPAISCLYVQFNAPDISEQQLDSELSTLLSKHQTFNQVWFVGKENCLLGSQSWITNGVIHDRLAKKTTNLKLTFSFVSFDESTGKHVFYDIAWRRSFNVEDEQKEESGLASLRQDCLLHIFTQSGAFIEAPYGVHYETPSKRHTNVFLRTSSVLEQSGHLSIIIFWLLPYVYKKQIVEIFVDTSSISSVAVCLAYEALNSKYINQLPTISSFTSYAGIQNLKIRNPENTLILVSAAMSGGLRKELLAKKAINDNLITLYSLEYLDDDAKLLCVLKGHHPHAKSFNVAKYYSKETCHFCKQKLFTIPLHGDLFSVEPPKTELIEITRRHLPDTSKKLLDKYSATGFFKVCKRINDQDLELFLDIAALFVDPSSVSQRVNEIKEFQATWRRQLYRGFAVNLRRIIFTSSPYSDQLARDAKALFEEKFSTSSVKIISSRELQNEAREAGVASLVISACLDNAYELTGINLDLRDIQPDGNVTYMSAAARGTSNIQRERVKSTLTYGNAGPNAYDLYALLPIDLPECMKKHSWAKELEALLRLKQWADDSGKDIPSEIEERIQLLYDAPATGLSENLFWNSPLNLPLSIRNDFVFIDNSGTLKLSQADIYTAISMVLHALRQGSNGNPPILIAKAYHRCILAPENFSRFNDGVIHASLLRAAREHELNFATCSLETSNIMKDFLLARIDEFDKTRGEALMEFLIALLTKSLVLPADHVKEITEKILAHEQLPSYFKLVCEYLVNHELSDLSQHSQQARVIRDTMPSVAFQEEDIAKAIKQGRQ